MRIKLLIIRIFIVCLLGCSIIATLGFLFAETPEEAAKKGWAYMPQTWEAGVFNHGSYIQWFSLSKHPFLFALSIACIAISGFIINYLDKRPD
jgi:hypothetical protein